MNILLFSDDDWGLPLAPTDYRALHIRKQLELHAGDFVRVGLLGRGCARARLMDEPDEALPLNLDFPRELKPLQFPPVHLLIGQPRPPVFQRLLRDLASMGVARMSWVHTALGEKSYLSSRAWRPDLLERQLRLGLEQGAHTNMPLVRKFYSLRACLDELGADEDASRFLLEPPREGGPGEGNPPLHEALGSCAPGKPVIIAVGPERGWTPDELQALQARAFQPLRLGQALLRTETAAVLAAGMALLHAGEGG